MRYDVCWQCASSCPNTNSPDCLALSPSHYQTDALGPILNPIAPGFPKSGSVYIQMAGKTNGDGLPFKVCRRPAISLLEIRGEVARSCKPHPHHAPQIGINAGGSDLWLYFCGSSRHCPNGFSCFGSDVLSFGICANIACPAGTVQQGGLCCKSPGGTCTCQRASLPVRPLCQSDRLPSLCLGIAADNPCRSGYDLVLGVCWQRCVSVWGAPVMEAQTLSWPTRPPNLSAKRTLAGQRGLRGSP